MTVEQVEAIRDVALAQMAALLATSGPVITAGDVHVTWPPLLAEFQRTVDWCDRKLGEYEPYEVRSRGA